RVLSQTRDPKVMESQYEQGFAHDEKYIKMYREGHAYHGVHPFYMWYWGIYGAAWCGKVIAVGGDRFVADRLGFGTAPTIRAALEQAQSVVGPSPSVTCFHWPPIFLCDVERRNAPLAPVLRGDGSGARGSCPAPLSPAPPPQRSGRTMCTRNSSSPAEGRP